MQQIYPSSFDITFILKCFARFRIGHRRCGSIYFDLAVALLLLLPWCILLITNLNGVPIISTVIWIMVTTHSEKQKFIATPNWLPNYPCIIVTLSTKHRYKKCELKATNTKHNSKAWLTSNIMATKLVKQKWSTTHVFKRNRVTFISSQLSPPTHCLVQSLLGVWHGPKLSIWLLFPLWSTQK